MNTTRSLWFESHLLAERAGRKAREACERLGTQAHETILAAADRLATASPGIAQQFYRGAAGVWQALGATEFVRWFDLGHGLLVGEPAQRDAAAAYFSVPPRTLAQVGIASLAAWCDTGSRVAAVSRKLGALFLEGTAPLIGRRTVDALAEWARHGMRLHGVAGHGVAGWRGEFLAQAYFAAAAEVLPVLQPSEYGPWADVGVALHVTPNEQRFFTSLPPGLARLSAADRALFFAATLLIAGVDAASGAAFYRNLPAALRLLHGTVRTKLLQVLHAASTSAAHQLTEIVTVVGALVGDIPKPHRLPALGLAEVVAREFPLGTAALLRSLPKAYEEAPHVVVEQWLRRGLILAAENAAAGVAYLALESRTSLSVLQASSTAATLSDVQGVLRKYIHMLSGQPVSIRLADPLALRPPLEEFAAEAEVGLPARIDLFETYEDNCRVYQFLAAQLAGRREFGTYNATLPASANGSLVAFLRGPEHPALLEEVFLLVEGIRIAAAVGRVYPGVAREQRSLATQVLSHLRREPPPSQSVLLDAVLAFFLSAQAAAILPSSLRAFAALVAPCVAPLARREATVDDSLAAALALTAGLAQLANRRYETGIGDLLLDKVSGDALIDPFIDDGSALLASEAGQGQANAPSPPLANPDERKFEVNEMGDDVDGTTSPLSADELQRLIEAGADLRLKQGHSDDAEGLGLYITDLLGKLPPEQLDELRRLLQESAASDRPALRRWIERRGAGAAFYYDEWDYHIGDYRQRWCRLREITLEGDAGEFFHQTLQSYAALIPEVRRQFQRIRPEMYRTLKGLEDGEDFDLNAVVSARVDRRARRPPSTKLYVARAREERDVATLFLIDMSASTDEPLHRLEASGEADDAIAAFGGRVPRGLARARRIIDVTKEALVIMAQALTEIGDAYAIYGFSGHGREDVEFYLIKSFNEPLSGAVKGRIGAVEPKRSTRMGTALRHAAEKMASVSSRSRHIILLSDGFPQDFDYGQDRRSNIYGLRDTTVALREAEAAGITPFCITVDKAGHDYLREMCDGSRYMVIEDIAALPHELPKIYQRVVGTPASPACP